MPALRIRQHVNPFALSYLEPRARAVEFPAHLGPASRVDVELGCADAQFSFDLARRYPDRLVVGLDIREKITDHGRKRASDAGLDNLVFGYVNLNVDLHRVFARRSVDAFHLLFPDPWFKPKHHKRRVVDAYMCETIAAQLRPGGEVHVASDIFEVALEAMANLEESPAFLNELGAWSFWRGNPHDALSRREETTLARGQRVWRMRYRLKR